MSEEVTTRDEEIARLTARVAELEQELDLAQRFAQGESDALVSWRRRSAVAEKRVEEFEAELASLRKVVEAAREVSDAVDEYQGEDDELFQLIREKCEARWVAVALEELQLALAAAGKDSGPTCSRCGGSGRHPTSGGDCKPCDGSGKGRAKTIGKDGAGSAGGSDGC